MKSLCLFLALVPLCALMCSHPMVAGGTTDTGNARISATIYNSAGQKASNARVILRPSDYIQYFSTATHTDSLRKRETVTDASGKFFFDSLPMGVYCIEANDGVANAVLLKVNINSLDFTDSNVFSDTLRTYSILHGSLGSNYGTSQIMFVNIVGLERCVQVDSLGNFSITNLPAGTYSYEIVSRDAAFKAVVSDSLLLTSGNSKDVQYACWSHSKQLTFNTTASGANTASDVYSFPVLVRLNATDMDFASANGTGYDLLFVKSDNVSLPYEIELWDSVNTQAEVWLKMDTVFANNSTQSVTMYWGNPNAASFTNSNKAFDTANGYNGVWHLGENSGIVGDATKNNYTGTVFGNCARSAGNIGYGIAFYDTAAYVDMGNVLNPGTANFTVSAWIKRNKIDTIMTIISKSKGGEPSSTYGWLIALDSIGRVEAFVATDTGTWSGNVAGTFALSANTAITDSTTWHHVAVVIDRSANSNCKIFLDGKDVSKGLLGNITTVGSISNTLPLRFGAEADNDYYLKGLLDEVEVSFTTRTSDWVRLCYMNQKSVDALVVFH